jgi:hypothetical protein
MAEVSVFKNQRYDYECNSGDPREWPPPKRPVQRLGADGEGVWGDRRGGGETLVKNVGACREKQAVSNECTCSSQSDSAWSVRVQWRLTP